LGWWLLGLGRLQRPLCDDRAHLHRRQKPKGLSTLLARLLALLALLVLPLVPLLFLVLLHD
jgi:hypothetical protein